MKIHCKPFFFFFLSSFAFVCADAASAILQKETDETAEATQVLQKSEKSEVRCEAAGETHSCNR